ncbi:MAG: hypothetical protein R3D55_27690 [Chloroflexota bacterium]
MKSAFLSAGQRGVRSGDVAGQNWRGAGADYRLYGLRLHYDYALVWQF